MTSESARWWVVDTSSIIEIDSFFESPQSAAAGDDALDKILAGMEELAAAGRLLLPIQVRNECQSRRVADFAERAFEACRGQQPSYEAIREVMACAGDVVSLSDENDVADPWVLAQALEMSRQHDSVWLVTEDRRDRLPKKLSLMTAAHRLRLDVCRAFVMLREEQLWP